MSGDAFERVIRDLEAERYRPVPTPPAITVRVGQELVTWPPAGVEPRTVEQQAEARRILDEETRLFDCEHPNGFGRRLKAVS